MYIEISDEKKMDPVPLKELKTVMKNVKELISQVPAFYLPNQEDFVENQELFWQYYNDIKNLEGLYRLMYGLYLKETVQTEVGDSGIMLWMADQEDYYEGNTFCSSQMKFACQNMQKRYNLMVEGYRRRQDTIHCYARMGYGQRERIQAEENVRLQEELFSRINGDDLFVHSGKWKSAYQTAMEKPLDLWQAVEERSGIRLKNVEGEAVRAISETGQVLGVLYARSSSEEI